MRLSYVDPKLLKPPSSGLLAAIDSDKTVIEKITEFLTPESPKGTPEQPTYPSYPNALPATVTPSMGELTIDAAAERLLDIRRRMSDAWPLLVARARAGGLARAEMAVWNGAQWRLTDMEMSLARRLSELGVKTELGKRVETPTPDELQKRMQVGRFAGVPDATLGVTVSPLIMWALVALGALLASAAALWAGSQFVKSFSAEELAKLDTASRLVDCVARGNCGEASLKTIGALNIRVPEPKGTLPGWAKGAIAIGATAVGVLLAVNIIPTLRKR